jgi:hypothetical protein
MNIFEDPTTWPGIFIQLGVLAVGALWLRAMLNMLLPEGSLKSVLAIGAPLLMLAALAYFGSTMAGVVLFFLIIGTLLLFLMRIRF